MAGTPAQLRYYTQVVAARTTAEYWKLSRDHLASINWRINIFLSLCSAGSAVTSLAWQQFWVWPILVGAAEFVRHMLPHLGWEKEHQALAQAAPAVSQVAFAAELEFVDVRAGGFTDSDIDKKAIKIRQSIDEMEKAYFNSAALGKRGKLLDAAGKSAENHFSKY